MWVVLEVRAPGMQNGEDAKLGTEMLGIGRDHGERLGGGAEQDAVDEPFVLQGNRGEFVGDREDHVEVLDGENLSLAISNPVFSGLLLALGTVPVSARVEDDAKNAARVAPFDMPALLCSATGGDVTENAPFGT